MYDDGAASLRFVVRLGLRGLAGEAYGGTGCNALSCTGRRPPTRYGCTKKSGGMTMANLRIPGVLAASLLWAPMITGPAAAVEMTAGKPSAEAEALAGQVRTAAQTGAGDALGVL